MSWNRQRALRKDYRDTFNTPHGRRVLADLADHCCMMRPSFTPGDPHMTDFSEGARSVALRIFEKLDKDEEYLRELEIRRKKTARQIGDDDE